MERDCAEEGDGEAMKKGEIEASEHFPAMQSGLIELTEPLVYKFLYTYIEGGYEIEIEIEWAAKGL